MINLDTKKEIIEKIVQKYSIDLLLLFGSQVTGRTHKESDYDIAYLSQKKLSLTEEGQLMIDLLPVIEQNDERMVNLVNIKKAKPLLLYMMTEDCQVLYEKDDSVFPNVYISAFKKYVEAKPLYEHREKKLLQS